MSRRSTIDPDKLEFPSTIAPIVGLSANEITFLKKRGCPFLRTEDDRALGKRFRFPTGGGGGNGTFCIACRHLQHSNGVNPVHQSTRMINKTHSLLFGQSRAVASRNERHPQRMRCCPYRPLEHNVEPLIHCARQRTERCDPCPQWEKDFFNCSVIGTANNFFGSSGLLFESSTHRIIFSKSMRSVGMLDSAKRQPI